MALDLHPKCRYAVSAGQDYVFNLWDLKEQSPPQKFEGHKVSSLAYFRDTSKILNLILMELP